jgi:primosomal protein N' (replication factor Y) (superfamily II helicase)
MHYYKMLVGDSKYHGSEALTYSSESELRIGSVVRVKLRQNLVMAIVVSEVSKPSFVVKPIVDSSPVPALSGKCIDLIEWMADYYPAPLGVITKQFLPPTTSYPKTSSMPSAQTKPKINNLPALTVEQTEVAQGVRQTGYHLLHGVTGSGKTRVYQELALKAIASGKSVIIITPEIGLTAQLSKSFVEVFSNAVTVLHSRLTVAARRNAWYTILGTSKPQIIIGARSALFAPLNAIGLIIIDEAHDQSLKSDSLPRYRTDRVAAKLANLHACPLICGSATPNIEDYYVAQQKQLPILRLSERAITDNRTTNMQVVDLKDRSLFARNYVVSDVLLATISSALQRNEQALLFLNRRGTANAILCNKCGWQSLCTHCDLPLSYHKDNHAVRCHVCGRNYPLPTQCPDCGNADIILRNIGTKAVVDEVQKLFPNARIARFDTDTAKPDQLESQLQTLKDGTVDILIGTQMIAKGLDLPKLGVVGVLNADSSLHIPDFTAQERTFQLLKQVIGRVGRGHTQGNVVIQTYEPTSLAINAALSGSQDEFYRKELAERQAFNYPPFTFMLKLSCLRATSKGAEKAAQKLVEIIREQIPSVHVEGPAPTFHPKEQGKYRWQVVIKSPHRKRLLQIIDLLPANWTHDIDPINLL